MFDGVAHKLRTIRLWDLLWIFLILFMAFTGFVNLFTGGLWAGHVHANLLLIDSVDAFVMALVVTGIFFFIINKMRTFESKALNAFQNTNVRFMTLVNTMPDMVILKDAAGRHIIVNKAVTEVMGYVAGEILGKTIEGLLPPDTAATCRKSDEEAMRQSQPTHAEEQIVRKDGKVFYFDMIKAPMKDAQGNLFGLIAVGRDITENKKIRTMLEEKTAEQNAILENATIGIAYLKGRRFVRINGRMEQMFGYGRDEVSGLTTEVFYPSGASYEELGREAYPLLSAGKTYHSKRLMKKKDGTCFWCSISGKAVDPDASGKGSIWILQDISEQKNAEEEIQRVNQNLENLVAERTRELAQTNKRLVAEIAERKWFEEELVKAQKLESLGVLAGGIAHDFNNILTIILGNIEVARISLPSGEEAGEQLSTAKQAAIEARGITRQLLTFAKGGAPIKKVVSLPQFIRESMDFSLRGANVRAEYGLPPDLWNVEIDVTQINQVLSNLAINAVQAMPEGGTLTVTARNEAVEQRDSIDLQKGRYVGIEIADQGIGIPKELHSKIFDPYFTTKESGSGLGLAIVYSVIRRHGGAVMVNSAPGEGCTFVILLPATEKKQTEEQMKVEQENSHLPARILVMDDEEAIDKIAARMLKRLGYRVETVKDGTEAIAAYRQALAKDEPFGAVITDLTVPGGMGGKETIRHLLAIDPQARVIVSSGYANDPIMSNFADFGFKGVIPKPYMLEELDEALREVFAGKKEECP